MVIINKFNINTEMSKSIEEYIQAEGIKLLARIPFDKNFVKAIQSSKSIVEFDNSYKNIFKDIWDEIQNNLLNDMKSDSNKNSISYQTVSI
jgi:MinD superfamily P-loop ATPase